MLQAVQRLTGMSRIAVRQRMQFRFDFIMTLVSTLMFSVLYFMLWKAIYQYSTDAVMPWQQLITYVMVGQTINFARWSPAERAPTYEVARRVRSGDIALDLIRPVDFQLQRFVEAAGFFVVEMLWVNVPAMLLLIFILGISPPADLYAALGFMVSLVIGFLVAFSLNSIVMMISFLTTNTFGVQIAKRAMVDIFAGTLIPFEFFPAAMRTVLEYLPFQAMAYIPLSIYTGRLSGWHMVESLFEQLAWAIVMIIISRLLWMKAAKRLTINGG
ncbi:ABC transporter permease [Paenibacillus radicis (ex Xue et al. 2023)]|uniref:ABC-2 family transporter protein n=1 Tax=Paenibacillus radicis (ex Xue et al. 2023) TaxID=2972489 RepID=A0ABT1YCJ5_9BACL|nr:ABC-2 family transporter protein [Paenibacillus radicis (ex Xue et al. 2023)]MCR8630925.1 ABC-2 family transporter protein [Paenibacillus radicis (ex Xue et al. 2023)]